MYRFIRNPDPREKPPYGSILDPHHPMSQGLVASWLMNEGGGNKVFDISKSNNHGSIVLGQWETPDGVRFVSGTVDYIEIDPILNPAVSDFTFGLILKFLAVPSSQVHLLQQMGTDGRAWIYLNESSLQLYSFLGKETTDSNFTATVNKWHHIILRKTGSTLQFYIDGQPKGSNTITAESSSDGFLFGTDKDKIESATNANILASHFYNSAITSAEIAQLYAEPYANILVPQYWFMADFGAAAVIEDVSIILSNVLSVSQTGGAVSGAGISLGQGLGVSDGGDANADGLLTMQKIVGLLQSGYKSVQSTIDLANHFTLSLSSDAISEATLATAVHLATTTDRQASIETSISLDQFFGASLQAQAEAYSALVFAYQNSMLLSGQTSSESLISLAVKLGISINWILETDVSIMLAQKFGVSHLSQVSAFGNLTISQILGISTLASVFADAGISLSMIQSVTITEDTIIAAITTPDARTFTISVEVRAFAINTDARTFTINIEDRTYKI